MNLLITTSTKLSDRERDVILPEIVLGFQECCAEAGANMTQSPIGKRSILYHKVGCVFPIVI